MIFSFGKAVTKHGFIGRLDGITQELWLSESTLRYIARHRQLAPWSTEAGGQLFGTIDAQKISLIEAVGPYAGDERSRHLYRSNPVAAQRAIDERSRQNLLYLGEWHTHAEDIPSASRLDDDAMHRLIAKSHLNSNSLLMMIVGRAQGGRGLAMWSVFGTVARQWELSQRIDSS
jgi:integrative and conjugative element protein (TIGR02256 family)